MAIRRPTDTVDSEDLPTSRPADDGINNQATYQHVAQFKRIGGRKRKNWVGDGVGRIVDPFNMETGW